MIVTKTTKLYKNW